jgi:(+)-trans-carveol dehydrogenase
MGRVDGKVALITGAARSQGRSHAVRLAAEGADIIAIDACAPIAAAPIPMSTIDDLAETARLVENLDRRVVTWQADVRDTAGLQAAVEAGLAELGHIDIVCANAGIFPTGSLMDTTDEVWSEVIDVNLTGVFKTVRAVAPSMIERGEGGSIIITSSSAGIKGVPNTAPYTSSKHGVVGLMRTLANELAPHRIRVNTVHPTGVDTIMIQNDPTYRLLLPDADTPTREQAIPIFQAMNALPVPWVEVGDVSNAILYLASDESRYVTGSMLPVDAGMTQK